MKRDELISKVANVTTETALWLLAAGIMGAAGYINKVPDLEKRDAAKDLIALIKRGEVQAHVALEGAKSSVVIDLSSKGSERLQSLFEMAQTEKKPASFSLQEGKNAFCNFTAEADLIDYVARAIKYDKAFAEAPSFSKLARFCHVKPEELQAKIKVSVNEQEFKKYTAPATPHSIVSNGMTVSTLTPQPLERGRP